MTPIALLRHAYQARADARCLLADGHLGLAALRSRDAVALERLVAEESNRVARFPRAPRRGHGVHPIARNGHQANVWLS